MRFAAIAAIAAAAVVLAADPFATADARDRDHERRGYSAERGTGKAYRRSSTEDRHGLCQRDTGRPMETLNLNHRCDREEFWARFNDLGDNRR